MPIRPEFRPLYPPHWRELSRRVRFEREGGEYGPTAGRISLDCAVCRTGAGSMPRPAPGATGRDGSATSLI